MNARKSPSEFTPGAWWVFAESVPVSAKLSKSKVAGTWYLVSSWSSEVAAESACQWYRSQP